MLGFVDVKGATVDEVRVVRERSIGSANYLKVEHSIFIPLDFRQPRQTCVILLVCAWPLTGSGEGRRQTGMVRGVKMACNWELMIAIRRPQ